MQKSPVVPRSLFERMVDFGTVTLRNQSPEVRALPADVRGIEAMRHVTVIAEAGGEVLDNADRVRLACELGAVASRGDE